jgi:hypothetical protein
MARNSLFAPVIGARISPCDEMKEWKRREEKEVEKRKTKEAEGR